MTLQKKRYKKIATMRPSKEVEKNFLPSETVPDQTLSVREIMQKFASGTLGDISSEPFYNDDMPDYRGMDISQMHNLREQGRKDLAIMQESVKKAKANKQQKPPSEEAQIQE